MKLKFKVQPYQTMAVDAVVDCFAGQPFSVGPAYRIDPGKRNQAEAFDDEGFRNPDIALTDAQLLTNINAVQRRQNLPQSPSLTSFVTRDAKGRAVPAPAAYLKNMAAAAPLHLDVEMETGTGKTYCYIKTMFELNRRYGWSKFIIIVPSIAIREGVAKSLSITAEHFTETYGKKARFFIYNSKRLHELESFVYDPIDERYDADIFTAAEIGQDFSRATERLKNHVFDYCITDSGVERDFVGELDTSAEVEVYAKLPRGFLIPTPVGDYNPDWAIVFRAGAVKHIYFVAETKGSMSSLALRDLERAKIDCAKKFFAKLGESNPTPNVRYGVADSYNKLMEIVTT